MTPSAAATASPTTDASRDGALTRPRATLRPYLVSGVLVGGVTAAAPLALWWLNAATVYAMAVAAIAAIYIGFAVADGRPRVLVVEIGVATGFVVVAAAGVTGSPWLLVGGLVGHGLKDLWQHRTHFVANTRWWPPFCCVVDGVAGAIVAVLIIAGVEFH